jgi:hypothetical protein
MISSGGNSPVDLWSDAMRQSLQYFVRGVALTWRARVMIRRRPLPQGQGQGGGGVPRLAVPEAEVCGR